MSCSPTMTLDHQPGQYIVWVSDSVRRQCSVLKDNIYCPCSLQSRKDRATAPCSRDYHVDVIIVHW